MTTVRSSRAAAAAALALLVTVLGGCGGGTSRANVSGTVKLQGKPPGFHGLEIVFQTADGSLTAASIQDDGTYSAPDVLTGEAQVFFAYTSSAAAAEGARFKSGAGRLRKPGQAAAPAPKATGKEPAKNPIPEHLREASTSKVTFNVESGKENVFNYDIPAPLQ